MFAPRELCRKWAEYSCTEENARSRYSVSLNNTRHRTLEWTASDLVHFVTSLRCVIRVAIRLYLLVCVARLVLTVYCCDVYIHNALFLVSMRNSPRSRITLCDCTLDGQKEPGQSSFPDSTPRPYAQRLHETNGIHLHFRQATPSTLYPSAHEHWCVIWLQKTS